MPFLKSFWLRQLNYKIFVAQRMFAEKLSALLPLRKIYVDANINLIVSLTCFFLNFFSRKSLKICSASN